MILVDTSTMIDALRGRENEKVVLLREIVLKNEPFAISIVTYQEILQGARDMHEYEKLQSYLGTQDILYLPKQIDFYNKASELYFKIRRGGQTIRATTDVFIAQTAIQHKMLLLHNDKDFDVIAQYSDLEVV